MPPPPAAARRAKSPPKKPPSGAARALVRLGLVRDVDLALHLPLRWVDETRLVPIAALADGDSAQVQGRVVAARVEHRARRSLVVRIADAAGDELVLRFVHFYPSQLKTFAVGAVVRARGDVRAGFFGREMVHPEFRIVDADTPLPQSLTPVYPTTAQLPQAYLRRAVASALARAPLAELLPPGTVPAGLPTLRDALLALHQPPPDAPLGAFDDRSAPAWQRLKFDELLAQQLSQARAVAAREGRRAPALVARTGGVADALRAALPFALTAAQRRVVDEIGADLTRPRPMHRLLQGDVGSGKTVVAALAAAQAIDAGHQCALMAPTELLAEQHFRKLVDWLAPQSVGIAWLSGQRKGRARAQLLDAVAAGDAQLVVGTHAVIQRDVAFARLGLAIVDEQHRFGVAQRLALLGLGGGGAADRDAPGDAARIEPHLLMMSATPIPRTLAMSYYADLALSTLDELPPGRTPVVTKVFADTRRAEVVARVRDAVAEGRQVYWVCPLVDESEHVDLQHATATHAELSAALPGVAVGLLHGRLASTDKADVMARFTAGALPLLVATTVIEVGVDVPTASLMVVEHAERFGLAQLHQLRGRVGRGSAASACVLLYAGPLSPTAKARLQAMAQTQDGFEIARRDLAIRGPGEFMGARQSGAALLRFADVDADADAELLDHARRIAPRLLRDHPDAARAHVERWLAGRADYAKA